MEKIKDYVHKIIDEDNVFVPNTDVVSFVGYCMQKGIAINGGSMEWNGRWFYLNR